MTKQKPTPAPGLPALPRILKKREAEITPAVLKWANNNLHGSFLLEIKATKGKTIPYSAVLPHQLLALKEASTGGVIHKLSDESRRQQPCDAFKVKGDGWIIACFTTHRLCFVIDAKEWKGCKITDSYQSFAL